MRFMVLQMKYVRDERVLVIPNVGIPLIIQSNCESFEKQVNDLMQILFFYLIRIAI